MGPVDQVGVAIGTDASGEVPRVDLALKGSSGVGGTETDGARLQIARIGWLCHDGCIRRYGIDAPGVGRWGCCDIARRVFRTNTEGMAAVSQVGVTVGTDTGGKASCVNLTLKGS